MVIVTQMETLEEDIISERLLDINEEFDGDKENIIKKNIRSDDDNHLLNGNYDLWSGDQNENVESDKTIPAKRNTSSYEKDKLKLLSENQRLIRENEVIEFKYKPKQCQTVKELMQLLKEEKNQKTHLQSKEVSIVETQQPNQIEVGCEEEMIGKASSDDGEIRPLRQRINLDPEIGRNLDHFVNKHSVQPISVDKLLREKYKNVPGGLIELKSSEAYRTEKEKSKQFLERLKANLMPVGIIQPQETKEIDFVVKEKLASGDVTHHITISNKVKCIKLAGQIDPILSKGVDVLLSEEERKRWGSMTSRDKWRKHRDLLLAAQLEKHRSAREERINRANLENNQNAKNQVAKVDDGLSDDDYEWREDENGSVSSSNEGSESDSVTDRGSEQEDDLEVDLNETLGGTKSMRRKARIMSDDEEDSKEESIDPRSSLKEFFEEGLQFFDIPTTGSTVMNDDNEDDLLPTVSTSVENNNNNSTFCSSWHSLLEGSGSCDQSERSIDGSNIPNWSINHTLGDNNTLSSSECTLVDVPQQGISEMSASTVILDETGNGGDDDGVALSVVSDELPCTMTSSDTQQLHSMRRKLFDMPNHQHSSSSTTTQALPSSGVFDNLMKILDGDTPQNNNGLLMDVTKGAMVIDRDIDDVVLDDDDSDDDDDGHGHGDDGHGHGDDGHGHGGDDGVDLDADVDVPIKSVPMISQIQSALNQRNDFLFKADKDNFSCLKDEKQDDNDGNDDSQGDDDGEEEEDNDDGSIVDEDDEDNDDGSIIDDDGEDDEDNEPVFDDEEEMLRQQVIDNKRIAKRFVRKEFFEDEAELSGSDADEFGPDEDETGLDMYENEGMVDDDEELPSNVQLRQQLEKLHNRYEIDKDAQDIRYLKERYLEDGDLYLEGGQRTKRFNWAGMNDNDDDGGTDLVPRSGWDDDQERNDEDEADVDIEMDDGAMGLDDKDEDKNTSDLMEKYGQHLDTAHWGHRNPIVDCDGQPAWQVEDKIDQFSSNPSDRKSFNTSGARKYGSFMNKSGSSLASSITKINSSSANLSLKSRMQQHTFIVHDKASVINRNATKRSNDSINDSQPVKKNRIDNF